MQIVSSRNRARTQTHRAMPMTDRIRNHHHHKIQVIFSLNAENEFKTTGNSNWIQMWLYSQLELTKIKYKMETWKQRRKYWIHWNLRKMLLISIHMSRERRFINAYRRLFHKFQYRLEHFWGWSDCCIYSKEIEFLLQTPNKSSNWIYSWTSW